jgi:hypothetical protein
VDTSQDPDAIVAKLDLITKQRGKNRSFVDLMNSGRFTFAIVTPTARKRGDIERAMDEKYEYDVPWELHVVDDLLQLLPWIGKK